MQDKVNRSKYGNKKIVVDGIKFDSIDEHDYFVSLQEWQEQGKVLRFERQPRLTLIPPCVVGGMKQFPLTYTPDFFVEYPDGSKEYIDIKGFSTQQGQMRRKLYNYLSTIKGHPLYGIRLRWVTLNFKYGGPEGWIDYDLLQKLRAKAKKAKKGA